MGNDEIPTVEIVEMSVPESAWTMWLHSQNVDTGGFCRCGHEGLGVEWHANDCHGANYALKGKVRRLTSELYEQWSWNHAEHCGISGCKDASYPDCDWPLPKGLQS